MRGGRLKARLLYRIDVLGRRAEDRHLLFGREVEERTLTRVEWRSVIEEQRRPRGEPADEPVPHHPAAGREIEEPVLALEIAVEQMLAQVLEEDAARAMHDAFGNAGRA